MVSTASLAFPKFNETTCLRMGDMASAVAIARPDVSEARMSKYLEDEHRDQQAKMTSKKDIEMDKEVVKVSLQIVSYVYMMGYSAEDSRKLVYLKCKTGEFN